MLPGEKALSDDYLEEVIKAYERFFFHYTSSDLLIVNTSEIDFVERSEDLQALLPSRERADPRHAVLPAARAGRKRCAGVKITPPFS